MPVGEATGIKIWWKVLWDVFTKFPELFFSRMGGAHFSTLLKGWHGDRHIRFNTTMVGGGSHRLACGMCVYLYVCLYCLCVCTLISVYLIGCVLEQVSQVDAASLCSALWAPSELLLDGQGAASCYGREMKGREVESGG